MLGRVVGHPGARRQLEVALRAGRPSHAYLLIGPARVGKSTLGVELARALNCTAPFEQRPCGACRSCRLFAAGTHPDFTSIDRTWGVNERRARPPKSIPIEAVRALQHDAAMTSHLGGFKVYMIVEAERLSTFAMEALLKTLEEPAPRVVIVLTCVDAGKLPATIVSRCQVIKLGTVAADDIAAALIERHGVAPDRAALLSKLADGRPGWALAAATDQSLMSGRDEAVGEVAALDDATSTERLKFAERMATEHTRNPEITPERLASMLGWWRDLLLVRAGCEDLIVNVDKVDQLRQRAARLSIEEAWSAMRAIEASSIHLDENVQPRIALELMVVSLPRTG